MSTEPSLNEICVRCTQIFAKAEELFRLNAVQAENDFYPLPLWKKNASWCHLCVLSLHQVSEGESQDLQVLRDSGRGREAVISADIRATTRANILQVILRSTTGVLVSSFHIHIQEDGPALDYVVSTQKQTWSADTRQQAKSWLDECKYGHNGCDMSFTLRSTTGRRPTRLIDVGHPEPNGDDWQNIKSASLDRTPYLRLCDSKNMDINTQYVTLSHCWGRHPTVAWGRHPAITLTNEVYEQFYNRLPLAENTSVEARTFKHAVQVTRSLGFRYLWIDAICINQDDPTDKAHEISVMDETYANAAFNISATAASSGSGGLIYARDPISIEPCKRTISFENGQSREMTAYANRWWQEVDEGFVNTRAWVFQERILAPRILHFTRDQVFWECSTLKAGQSFPRGMPFGALSTNSARDHVKNWHEVDVVEELEDWEIIEEIWASLIPLYSLSNLSFEQDKLPAISGIARRLRGLTSLQPGDYIAGLWRPALVDQLLWRTDLAPNKGRSMAYRAPSWSWACLDAQTYPNTRRAKECAVSLLDVGIKLKDSDPFGQITHGWIRLKGPLCKISCIKGGSDEDFMLEINRMTHDRQLIQTDWDVVAPGCDTQESVIFSNFAPKPIYLLAFYPYPEPAANLFGTTGLILEASGEKPGQYMRLGLFKLWHRYPEAHQILVEAFCSRTLEPDTYLDFDGQEKYTIEIM